MVSRSDHSSYTYLEEFPIDLLDTLSEKSGHQAESVIAVVMQYGANFSGKGPFTLRDCECESDIPNWQVNSLPIFFCDGTNSIHSKNQRKTETEAIVWFLVFASTQIWKTGSFS